jgi:hypothetical protein
MTGLRRNVVVGKSCDFVDFLTLKLVRLSFSTTTTTPPANEKAKRHQRLTSLGHRYNFFSLTFNI